MVKFRDRLLDIVERHHEGQISVSAMMDLFDEVIADVGVSTRNSFGYRYAAPVGVAAPLLAQDAKFSVAPMLDRLDQVEARLDRIESTPYVRLGLSGQNT